MSDWKDWAKHILKVLVCKAPGLEKGHYKRSRLCLVDMRRLSSTALPAFISVWLSLLQRRWKFLESRPPKAPTVNNYERIANFESSKGNFCRAKFLYSIYLIKILIQYCYSRLAMLAQAGKQIG